MQDAPAPPVQVEDVTDADMLDNGNPPAAENEVGGDEEEQEEEEEEVEPQRVKIVRRRLNLTTHHSFILGSVLLFYDEH